MPADFFLRAGARGRPKFRHARGHGRPLCLSMRQVVVSPEPKVVSEFFGVPEPKVGRQDVVGMPEDGVPEPEAD